MTTYKIPYNSYLYLTDELSKEENKLVDKIFLISIGRNAVIELDDDTACDILDWLFVRYDTFGFDSSYTITSDGKLIEVMMDIIHDTLESDK